MSSNKLAQKPILLVEDSEEDAEDALRAFKSAGIANPVFTANDGEIALCWLKGEGVFANRDLFPLPGVLLLNLKLSRKDWLDVLRWLSTQPQLCWLLIVAIADFDHIAERVSHAFRFGARYLLLKPLHQSDLLPLVKFYPEYWVYFAECKSG